MQTGLKSSSSTGRAASVGPGATEQSATAVPGEPSKQPSGQGDGSPLLPSLTSHREGAARSAGAVWRASPRLHRQPSSTGRHPPCGTSSLGWVKTKGPGGSVRAVPKDPNASSRTRSTFSRLERRRGSRVRSLPQDGGRRGRVQPVSGKKRFSRGRSAGACHHGDGGVRWPSSLR